MQPIAPTNVRFIKLGQRGEWEPSCIQGNTIRIGYKSPHHQDSLSKNWDVVWNFWLNERSGDKAAATRDRNQIRDFYELGENDVWITFYERKLYWCRADRKVIELSDGSRIRNTIVGWSATDLNGRPLRIENIDGRITKVQGFRGTVCRVELQDYLVEKINGQTLSEVKNTKVTLERLQHNVQDLIKGLWWHDFELLMDLIFSRAGWQRFSVLGKTEKDIDLEFYSPTMQKRAFMQIKSSTTKSELISHINRYNKNEQYDEVYFAYHTCDSDLSDVKPQNSKVHVLGLQEISQLVINSGLTEWLINKRS